MDKPEDSKRKDCVCYSMHTTEANWIAICKIEMGTKLTGVMVQHPRSGCAHCVITGLQKGQTRFQSCGTNIYFTSWHSTECDGDNMDVVWLSLHVHSALQQHRWTLLYIPNVEDVDYDLHMLFTSEKEPGHTVLLPKAQSHECTDCRVHFLQRSHKWGAKKRSSIKTLSGQDKIALPTAIGTTEVTGSMCDPRPRGL